MNSHEPERATDVGPTVPRISEIDAEEASSTLHPLDFTIVASADDTHTFTHGE